MPRVEWSSNYSGYLRRASRHPEPHAYTPQRNHLTLVAFRSEKGDHRSFSLALFSDRVAVDANGHVYVLDQRDYDGIMQLVQAVARLPKAEGYRNQWRVRQERTCYPTDYILCATSPRRTSRSAVAANIGTRKLREIGVYGFDENNVLLDMRTRGYVKLPGCLWGLTGLVIEVRERPGKRDDVVHQRVRSILEDVVRER